MTAPEIIEQKVLDRKTCFQFGEDKVEFRFTDPTGEVNTAAYYEAIDLDNFTQVKVRTGRRYLWAALAVMVVSIVVMNITNMQLFATIPMVAYAAFAFVIRFTDRFMVRITVFGAKTGNSIQRLRIINDTNYDAIVARLRAGWRARIRKLYANVNPAADPAKEAERFRWMLERQVIDETEYQRALAVIASASAQPREEGQKLN